MADIINRRMNDQTGTLYLLENAQEKRVIGNLADLLGADQSGTWLEFPVAFGKGASQAAPGAWLFGGARGWLRAFGGPRH
ncbi:MAG: hypothetical protein U1E15_10830 [Hyphomicrobiales bacterium]